MALSHNSKLSPHEPEWGSLDHGKLPDNGFADEKDRKYPHHWVKDGKVGADKHYESGDMFLHRGGLIAAWSAANGGRSGQEASSAIKAHLNAHRKAIGLEDEEKAKQSPQSALFLCQSADPVKAGGPLRVVMCSSALNRNKWRVRVEGMKLQSYLKNPAVLLDHGRTRSLPIGQAVNPHVEDGQGDLAGQKLLIADDIAWEPDPLSQQIADMYRRRSMRAWSVQYQPTVVQAITDEDGGFLGLDILESDLLELSAEAVGADPSALAQAITAARDETTIAQLISAALEAGASGGQSQGGSVQEGVSEMDEKTIRADAQKQSAENLKALQAAFPEDAPFALQSAAEGLAVESAKARHYDVLAQSLVKVKTDLAVAQKSAADLTAENAGLKQQILQHGAAPVGDGTGAKISTKFIQRARQYQKEHKCSFTQAIRDLRQQDPEGVKAAEIAGEL